METTSSTQNATRSLITSLGVGSGIDMASLANDLAAAQFSLRTDRLAAKSERLEASISSASNLRSMLLSLSTSLGDRIRVGDLSPQPNIANGAVAGASLSGTRQPSGSYSLEVTALAASQTLASPAYAAASDPFGSGTLTLRFGTVVPPTTTTTPPSGNGNGNGNGNGGGGTTTTPGSFTEDPTHPAVSVTIAPNSTLADIAKAINTANAGISAYVANTVDGARLVLKGAEGAANGFVLEAAETPGEPGLGNLAWNPASASGDLLTSATDAAFKVDGLSMTATSNTISEAIPGVTLALKGTNAGAPTQISFSDPSTNISEAMRDLTAALNEIATELRSATDPKTGELARDAGARTLQRAFASLAGNRIMPGAADGVPATLSDLGLSTQRDGSFILDPQRLADTLARDPEAVAAMFTRGVNGIFGTIDSISRAAGVTGNPSSLAGSISRNTAKLSQLTEDQAELAEKQEAMRARLTARFAVSENRIGTSRSTLTFLENQIAAWNSQGN